MFHIEDDVHTLANIKKKRCWGRTSSKSNVNVEKVVIDYHNR